MNSKFKKILASVFVLAMVAAPLYGCGDSGKTKSSNSSTSSTGGTQDEHPIKVTLKRKIYLVNESLEVVSIEMWRDALGFYSPVQNYVVQSGWNTTAGHKEVLINVGSEKVTVEVDVYDTAEDAVEANLIYDENKDMSQYFDESKFINTDKLTLKKETILGEDRNEKAFLRSFVGSKNINAFNTQGAGKIDVWTSTPENPEVSLIDKENKVPVAERAYSIPHMRKAPDIVSEKKDENGDPIPDPDNPGKNLTEVTHVGQTYLFGAYDAVQWRTEFIFDAEGRIAYMAYCMPDNSWTAAAGHLHTTKWYSHSIYANDQDNPALKIVTDPAQVDALASKFEIVTLDDSEVNSDTLNPNGYPQKYTYEKIIPEGGFYVFATNPEATTIWQWWRGNDEQTIDDTGASAVMTQANRNTEVDEFRAKLDIDKKRINFYAPSTLPQQYAYWYLEVLKGSQTHPTEYAEVLAMRDEIYKLLVESANPVVEQEKILKDYYDSTVGFKIGKWSEAVLNVQKSLAE